MAKRKRPKFRDTAFTPLSSQTREGTKLRGPLAKLNSKIESVDWMRDLLPEHLWLAALANKFGLDLAANIYNKFMDALDAHWPHSFVALGLISDFGLVPVEERPVFLDKNRELVHEAFHNVIGRALAFYPDGPAAWLINQRLLDSEGALDPFVELPVLRRLVTLLLGGSTFLKASSPAIPTMIKTRRENQG